MNCGIKQAQPYPTQRRCVNVDLRLSLPQCTETLFELAASTAKINHLNIRLVKVFEDIEEQKNSW